MKRVTQAGNTVVFSPEGNYIQDGQTGEVMELEEKGGLFVLKVWAKTSGF